MTEATNEPAAEPTSARPPLVRPRQGRMVLGVCAGLARWTDVDPVIYRVVAVVLTIFGGIGVLLYGLGWLLIPEEGSGLSEADRLLRRHRHRGRPRLLLLVVGVITVVWLAGVVRHGHNLAISAVLLALLAYLLLRDRGSAPPLAARGVAPEVTVGEPAAAEPPPRPTGDVRPPRSRLGWITLSVALVVAGALVAAREAGVDGLPTTRILAASVLVVGCGLLAGSVIGRARWLAFPGGALAAAMLVLVGIGVPVDGGVGNRTWDPTSVVTGGYHLGIGRATLDLGRVALSPGAPTVISASVAVGRLDVSVPAGLLVTQADARAAIGHVDIFGSTRDGVDPHVSVRALPTGLGDQIVLRLRVGVGDV